MIIKYLIVKGACSALQQQQQQQQQQGLPAVSTNSESMVGAGRGSLVSQNDLQGDRQRHLLQNHETSQTATRSPSPPSDLSLDMNSQKRQAKSCCRSVSSNAIAPSPATVPNHRPFLFLAFAPASNVFSALQLQSPVHNAHQVITKPSRCRALNPRPRDPIGHLFAACFWHAAGAAALAFPISVVELIGPNLLAPHLSSRRIVVVLGGTDEAQRACCFRQPHRLAWLGCDDEFAGISTC